MMIVRTVIVLIGLCALLMAGRSSAQDDPFASPLLVTIAGDLYRIDSFDAPPTPLTTGGTLSGAARSPGDAWIAWKTAAPVGIAALDRVQSDGDVVPFDLPADIVLLHLARGLLVTVAGQPADAAFLDPARPDHAVQRSAPAWSPDAAALAWTERDLASGEVRLMRYDVARASARVLTDLPSDAERQFAPPIVWGVGGIAVDLSGDAASDQVHIVFTPDGGPVGAVGVAALPGTSVRLTTWVDPGDERPPLFGLLYENAAWTLIDPATNTPVPYGSPPVLRAVSGAGWRLRFGLDDSLGFFWEIVGSNSAAIGDPNGVALSPDGAYLAVIGAFAPGDVAVFDGEQMRAIPGTGPDGLAVGSALWSAPYWVLP